MTDNEYEVFDKLSSFPVFAMVTSAYMPSCYGND